jgi:acetyl-CoA acetyltransferase
MWAICYQGFVDLLQLGSLIAITRIAEYRAHTCEATCASGAVAARAAQRVSTGSSDVAVACGVKDDSRPNAR